MRCCSRSKLGRPSRVERHDLAVEHRAVRAERPVERPDLGVLRADVVQVAALEPQPAGLGVRDRAHAVPFDLVRPAVVLGGQGAEPGHHRHEVLGHRLARRVGRRVHAVDQPVLLAPARLEERVAPLQALAVERQDDLARLPLVRLVGAACPRSSSSPRRSCPRGCRPRRSGTRAGGPRCARPCGCRPGPRGCRSGPPRTRARRRARAAGPSAAAWRGAPGRRSGAARRRLRRRGRRAQACARSRACARTP